MTPHQQARYERDLRIWEYRQKNPDAYLMDIGKMFGIKGGAVTDALKRIDRHLNHGEPYIKPVDYSKQNRAKTVNYNRPERLDFRTTRNPEKAWEQAGVRF